MCPTVTMVTMGLSYLVFQIWSWAEQRIDNRPKLDGKRIRWLQIVSQHVPIYLQQFPSYSNRKCKKSPFSRTTAHIFVSPGDAPATITQYVAWMERQFNACQTPRSMYLSLFNSFRVIRCLSQCISPKIAIITTFLFPLGKPLGQSR